MKKIKGLLWFIIIMLTLISVGLIVRRMLILMQVIAAVPAGARFAVETKLKDHPVLTIIHILPGLLFVLLGPFLLYKSDLLQLHGSYRRGVLVFIIAAYTVGLSAVVMPFVTMPIGGPNEAAAAVLYGLIFLGATTRVLVHALKGNRAVYRKCLLRTLAIGLAIATTRPVMVLAFAIGKVSPQLFLGTAFWIAFTIHLWAVETWIYFSAVTRKPTIND